MQKTRTSCGRGRFFAAASAVLILCGAAGAQVQFVEQQATRFPQPPPLEYSNQVAFADFDHDGDIDIAFANGGGFSSAGPPQKLRLFINNGQGVFTDETDARTGGWAGNSRDVQFGDVTGNGFLDMIVAQDFSKQPQIFINDGKGFFTNQTAARFPQINLGSPHVTLGDVDNDGDLDVCFANGGFSRFGTGPTQLWINDGKGFFTDQTAARLPAAPVSQPMDVLFVDVDNDLDLDIIVASRQSGNNTRLFINDGKGFFTNASAGLPPTGSTYSFDFGDFNNDGFLDVLGANSLFGSVREALWLNDGTGKFTDVTAAWLPGANNPNVDDNDSKFFDIDYDGNLDFVIASLSSTERIYQHTGSSYVLTSGKITPVADASLDVEVGDLDGDGTLDIVTAQGESGNFTNRIYMNNGPKDTLAPRLVLFDQLAAAAGPAVVRARWRDDMTSDQGFFGAFRIVYSVDGGPEVILPMAWAGHDMYRAAIPAQACGAGVKYRVEATDRAGNTGIGPDQAYTVSPYADCDANGLLNIDDFLCFQLKFALADPYADCDNNSLFNIDDFLCFQLAFALGC